MPLAVFTWDGADGADLEVSKADTRSKHYMQVIDGTQSSTNTTEEKEKEFTLPK